GRRSHPPGAGAEPARAGPRPVALRARAVGPAPRRGGGRVLGRGGGRPGHGRGDSPRTGGDPRADRRGARAGPRRPFREATGGRSPGPPARDSPTVCNPIRRVTNPTINGRLP